MSSPAFQFYPADFLSDENVELMSLAEQGVYIRLICYAWKQGSIPNDIESLSRLCRCSEDEMRRHWIRVSLCFRIDKKNPERLIHPRLEKERKKQRENSKKQSDRAKNRWEKEKSGYATALPRHNSGSASSGNALQSSSSSSPSGKDLLESSSVHEGNDDDLKDFPKETRDAMMSATLGGITYFTKHVKGSCIPKTKAPEFVSDLFVRAKKTNPRASPSQIKAAWEKTCDAAIKYNGKKPKYFETTFTEKLSELISGGQRL